MKLPVLFFALPVFICSCKIFPPVYRPLGNAPVRDPAPFVQLRDKEKTAVKAMHEKQDSVIADQVAYAKRDIAFYSDGSNTFANISKPGAYPLGYKFATKTIEGDFNIYTAIWRHDGNYKGKQRFYYSSKDYIQRSGSDDIAPFRYHFVKRILLPGEAGYEYLRRYKRNRLWGNVGFYGGMAVEFTGVGLGSNAHISSTLAASDALILTGICSVLTSAFVIVINKSLNLQKAVATHNHMIE